MTTRVSGCFATYSRTSATVASSACPAWMVRSALLACANSSMASSSTRRKNPCRSRERTSSAFAVIVVSGTTGAYSSP